VGYATGEAKEPPLRPTFDRRIKLEFHGARITSDGGLLAYRELDDALGLTDMAIERLLDGRRGRNTRHKLIGLFRQAVFGRLAGYEDVNDAERLARDPAIVTDLTRPNKRVVKFYNGRGTAEEHIKEGKNAIRWIRLSCHAFRHNAVQLQLHALAYNLANFLRTLALPTWVEHWSLTTLREKLVKVGARIVRHGRYIVYQLAEVAV
jgi:Transposase DDE domain group 1